VMENEPAAILFDLDDTLIAWDMVADQSWKKVCYDFAGFAKGLHSDALIQNINHVREWYFSNQERHKYARLHLPAYRQEIVKLAFARLGINNDGLADKIATAYGTERLNAAYVIPGTIKSLQYWKKQKVKLALVTNGTADMQRGKINRFALSRFFDFILIESEFGFGKPEKKVFTKVLKELNLNASQAWMVGDNLEFDVGGAQRAGIYSVWVDWQARGLPEFSPIVPDRTIKSIAELTPQQL
jgi:putative hydrolase of the HAD superfamily